MYPQQARALLFTSLTALAGAGIANAQETFLTVSVDGPVRQVSLKLDAEGVLHDLTREASTFAGGPAAQLSFSNTSDLNLFLVPLSGQDEYIDYGVKTRGLDGLVTEVKLRYSAQTLDTSVGGPGGKLRLNLYSGSTGYCAGNPDAPGTVAASLDLTGLPGSLSTPSGEIIEATIDLSESPVALPDGPIGWGLLSSDTSVLPALVFVGDSPTGTKDALDNVANDICVGQVSFMLQNRPVSSLHIELFESGPAVSCGFSSYGPFATATNSTLFATSGNGVGDVVTFTSVFDSLEGLGFLLISEQPASVSLPGTEVLVDFPSQLALLQYPVSLQGQVDVQIPNNPELAGMTVFCQSALATKNAPSGFELSNGLRFDICK